MSSTNEKTTLLLRRLADAAIAAAQADRGIRSHLPDKPAGRTMVIGAGKAAAAMSKAFESAWNGPLEGLAVTRYGHKVPCRQIEIIEASHPVPDHNGLEAAKRIMALVGTLGEDDLLVFLLSGGASALLPLPAGQITLQEKQALTDALLRSGASIDEINCVRRHVSAIKGGRLAAAAEPARIVTLAISDVAGDDPLAIGSGPTVADPTSAADALKVLERYGIDPVESVRNVLAQDEPVALGANEYTLVARPMASLEAARQISESEGLRTIVLGDALEGEARDAARSHAAEALELAQSGEPFILLSGGEFTVTMKGNGRGGPNTEYLLSLAISLEGQGAFSAIAVDTDGIDGSEDNAGAMIFADSLKRARDLGLDPAAYLANNDAYSFFEALDDLVITGPTLTNVNDFRAILYDPG